MQTVTVKQLEAIVSNINRLTYSPPQPYSVNADGKYTPCAGSYHLSGAYGGYALHRMSLGVGCTGVSDIFGGHMPKRELAERMWAFIKGLETQAAIKSALKG
jgi:hypothetical protein